MTLGSFSSVSPFLLFSFSVSSFVGGELALILSSPLSLESSQRKSDLSPYLTKY